MITKLLRYVIAILFGIIGFVTTDSWMPLISAFIDETLLNVGFFGVSMIVIVCYVLSVMIAAIIGYIISDWLIHQGLRLAKSIERLLNRMPSQELMTGTVGLLFGLIIANLIGLAFNKVPIIGPYLPILLSAILGYIGASLGARKGLDLYRSIAATYQRRKSEEEPTKSLAVVEPTIEDVKGSPKLLDTSVIIDGRIAEICSTGFLEGPFIVPVFVLEELQRISDSADNLKRARGRRGLDLLQDMQKRSDFPIIVIDDDFEDIPEVDSKLMKLAVEKGWKIITNDFNLNKVATLQGVKVLNINELANAIKPAMVSGEWIRVQVVKEGKEPGQGIAYLDDGTMIVIENGAHYVDTMVDTMVTSVLQTSAGRMIFARVEMEKE